MAKTRPSMNGNSNEFDRFILALIGVAFVIGFVAGFLAGKI